jgi:ribosome biogenesis GTPase / thiamine phosphate phosphatase
MRRNDLGWNSSFENYLTNRNGVAGAIGRIITVQKGAYLVQTETALVMATLSGSLRHRAEADGNLPAVGDWVELAGEEDDGAVMIMTLIPRYNKLSRHSAVGTKASGGPVAEQVIAANIDIIFVVCGLDRDFNLRRIERYLTLVYNSGAIPMIILNKVDLCDDPSARQVEVESVALGVKTLAINAHNPQDLDLLRQYLAPGTTIALLGSSGAGKSTIVNGLLGKERQVVRNVSTAVGKGVHTTTHRELITLPEGGMIIDNPGIRELQIWEDNEGLDMVFEDIEQLAGACRFSDCSHHAEPGCAVRIAIEEGTLSEARLLSFQKLKREIAYLDERKTKSARVNEKIKGREFARIKKEVLRRRSAKRSHSR